MENSPANQLPEVDSLPDGFVEGPSVSVAPRTPSNEKEKPCAEYKEDKLSESDTLNYSSNEVSASEFIPVEEKADKVRKLRTFPVPLSDKDDYDASRESANVSDEGFLNEREDALGVNSESSTSVSKVSTECHLGTSTTDGKEKYQSEVQSSTKVGSTTAEANIAKMAQLSDNEKTRKEMVEGKRKSSKRTFKTEQEFLEFTLKYQQVLAERDAGNNEKKWHSFIHVLRYAIEKPWICIRTRPCIHFIPMTVEICKIGETYVGHEIKIGSPSSLATNSSVKRLIYKVKFHETFWKIGITSSAVFGGVATSKLLRAW